MNGLTLSIALILFGLLLGASSGVALGSFVIPDDTPTPTKSRAAIQNSSPSTTTGVGVEGKIDKPVKTTDETTPSSETRATKASTAGSNIQQSNVAQPPSSFSPASNATTRLSPLLSSNNSVAQVSNQTSSTLLAGSCGDSNADGILDVGDIVTSLQLVVGLGQKTHFHEVFGDLNSDEVLNILDTLIALQFLISNNPVPGDCGPFGDQQ